MRRRPFRRRLPRGAFRRRGRLLPPAVRDAHFLALKGQPDRAANTLQALAREAAARGDPHAPQMFLQAGRFYALSGLHEQAQVSLETGLQMLAKSGPAERLARVVGRLALTLERQGHDALAEKVINLGRDLLPAGKRPEQIQTADQSEGGLPAKCPYCGAAVDPRDIEWLGDRAAMCEYCGSALEA